MWFIWKQFYLDVLNKHAPVANLRIKGNSLPYITAEAKAMIKQRDYLRPKANKTGSKFLRQAFQQVKKRVVYTVRDLRKNIIVKRLKKIRMI